MIFKRGFNIEKNSKVIGYRNAKTFNNTKSLLKSCDIGLSTVIIKKSILKKTDKFVLRR